MATRTTVINDPVGIHARPAAQFTQAVTASGCTVTIAKEGGNPVSANSILSVMGLGIKQGESVVIDVQVFPRVLACFRRALPVFVHLFDYTGGRWRLHRRFS